MFVVVEQGYELRLFGPFYNAKGAEAWIAQRGNPERYVVVQVQTPPEP